MRFLWLEDVTNSEIYIRMTVQYDNNCLIQRKVYKWVEIFRGRKTIFSEETRVYPKVSGLSHNEVKNNNNKQSLRSNAKGYGGKTH
jgi:hypothetical protein